MAKKETLSDYFYEVIEDDFLDRNEWKKFVRGSLKLTDNHISFIEHDYNQDGIREVKYQILKKWKNLNASTASVSSLKLLLEKFKAEQSSERCNQQPEEDVLINQNPQYGIRVKPMTECNPLGSGSRVEVEPQQHSALNNEPSGMNTGNDSDACQEDERTFCEEVDINSLKNLAIVESSAETNSTNNPSYYVNTTGRKGRVLIINNLFNGVGQEKYHRKGAERDGENMKVLWMQLGFEVDYKKNVKADETKKEIEDFTKTLRQGDIVVAFFMSHGKGDRSEMDEKYLGNDCNYVLKKEIISLFDGEKLPQLVDRPKLLFFQMCRGVSADAGITCNEDVGNPMAEVRTEDQVDAVMMEKIHRKANMLIANATLKGERAFRNETGSWFINAIANIFRDAVNRNLKDDILTLMTKVNHAVSSMTSYAPSNPSIDQKKVVSNLEFMTLTKKLFLF